MDSMETIEKLYRGVGQIRNVSLRYESKSLKEMRQTSKESYVRHTNWF